MGAKNVWKPAEVEVRAEGGVRGKSSHRLVGRSCLLETLCEAIRADSLGQLDQ